MSAPRAAHVEMLLVVLFWGGNFTASKLAFPTIPPLAFTAIRFAIGSVLLWVLVARLEGHRPLPRETLWPLIGLGLVGNTLYQVCFITGLAGTSATNTSLILSAMPTVVTVSAGALGMERVTARQRWALGLATIGVVLTVAARGADPAAGAWRGDLLILLAVGCWTAYTLGLRRLGGRISALEITCWTMITGTPGLLLIGAPGLVALQWGAIEAAAWAGLAYSTLLSLVAAYILWTRAVQAIGASRAALYTCLTPLIATSIAVLVLGERPTPWHLAGGGLIIAGVLLGNTRLLAPRGLGG